MTMARVIACDGWYYLRRPARWLDAGIVVDYVTDIDANPELHAALRLDGGIALCHLGLSRIRPRSLRCAEVIYSVVITT